MRRLYFLLPNISVTTQVVDELLLNRIDDHHIYIVANENTPLGDLPSASLLQNSDLIPSLGRGLAIGGITGVLAGLAAAAFSATLGGGTILATTLAGAGIGAWVSSMIGVDVRNTQTERFQHAIDEGQILVMVDVKQSRVEEIEELIHSHHPNASTGGVEPQIPAFP